MVIDTNVGDLKASTQAALLVSAGYARADPLEAAELLGVEVSRSPGAGVLVALDRWRR